LIAISSFPVDSQLAGIASEVRRKTKLDLGDSVIAATALLTKSVLVTRDKEMIKRVKNLVQVQALGK